MLQGKAGQAWLQKPASAGPSGVGAAPWSCPSVREAWTSLSPPQAVLSHRCLRESSEVHDLPASLAEAASRIQGSLPTKPQRERPSPSAAAVGGPTCRGDLGAQFLTPRSQHRDPG